MSATSHALTQEPRAAARLFDLRLEFELFPARYAHASWFGAEAELHRSAPAWVRSWSSALLRQEHLDTQFELDTRDLALRLALLDAATLETLGRLAAALFMRAPLRMVVERNAVTALQRELGADVHGFAVRSDIASPAILAPGRQWPHGLAGTWSQWAARGAAIIIAALPVTKPAAVKRLQFKFPRTWAMQPLPSLDESQRVRLVSFLIDIVATRLRDWHWLFDPQRSVC
jgi:hypothetical protein